MDESKKVKDLTDEELLENYKKIDLKIDAEYKIINSLKATKNEHLTEIIERFKGE